MTLFEKHQNLLDTAVNRLTLRNYWKPFEESPRSALHPDGAKEKAQTAFNAQLGKPFDLALPGEQCRLGKEVSPFTGEALSITYPRCDVDTLINAGIDAMPQWRDAGVKLRIGVCLEIVTRLEQHFFENAFATQHTTGQGFIMAFAGNGASALERGLEAITYAYKAMADIPEDVLSCGHFGGEEVKLSKRYRIHPVGVGIIMACGSYPAWNALPAMFASLAVGNPIIVKPHPNTILPVALQVRHFRAVLQEQGFDPNLVTLIPEEVGEPVAVTLMDHPKTAIVDFTGSQQFGRWIEENYRHLQVYTETAGCNSVLIESTDNYEGMINGLANSLCLFSSQMCTAPQNIYIPAEGIDVNGRKISFEDVSQAIVDAVECIAFNDKLASGLCGAIQTDAIIEAIADLTAQAEREATILRRSTSFVDVNFPSARNATPLLVQADTDERGLYQKEWFGPMAFIIKAKDREDALACATEDVKNYGAIASYLYSIDNDFLEKAQDAYGLAGASLGCNLIKHAPLNVSAAFTDLHVTGLNPAGNATLSDYAFIARRFRVTQTKTEIS